jgi:hypothetical protein
MRLREIGLLPLALRIWFEEVGQVNLNGRHRAWSLEYPDPLVVEAPVQHIRSEYEAWTSARGTEWDRGTIFEVPLAPDYLHKANVSGGMPLAVAVPNPGADGVAAVETASDDLRELPADRIPHGRDAGLAA